MAGQGRAEVRACAGQVAAGVSAQRLRQTPLGLFLGQPHEREIATATPADGAPGEMRPARWTAL